MRLQSDFHFSDQAHEADIEQIAKYMYTCVSGVKQYYPNVKQRNRI